jgi:hypothetical protein
LIRLQLVCHEFSPRAPRLLWGTPKLNSWLEWRAVTVRSDVSSRWGRTVRSFLLSYNHVSYNQCSAAYRSQCADGVPDPKPSGCIFNRYPPLFSVAHKGARRSVSLGHDLTSTFWSGLRIEGRVVRILARATGSFGLADCRAGIEDPSGYPEKQTVLTATN